MEIHNSSSDMEHLSNIELFYSKSVNIKEDIILIDGEECRHAVKVMRHRAGDEIFVTNGEGKIYDAVIREILKDTLIAEINKISLYNNKFPGVTFCLPKLKNPERFEFALEKCTELGICNFIIFESDRTISKSNKIERWNKIALSAMKQSLQSFLPSISTVDSIEGIKHMDGKKIVFEQNSRNIFRGLLDDDSSKSFFLFGPEGGFSPKELSLFSEDELFNLADNRLRSETAIIKCASLITAIV